MFVTTLPECSTACDRLDASALRIKKPIVLDGGVKTLTITYGRDDKKLYIQTPVLTLTCSPDDKLTSTFAVTAAVTTCPSFADRFQQLEESMAARIRRAFPGFMTVEHRKISPMTATADGARLRLDNDARIVRAFLPSRAPHALDAFRQRDQVVFLFSVDYFWIGRRQFGLECKLHQIVQMSGAGLSSDAPLLFLPATPVTPVTPKEGDDPSADPPQAKKTPKKPPPPPPPLPPPPPILAGSRQPKDMPEKYARMLKMGVPMDAVRHKMRLDGVGTDDGPAPNAGDPRAALFAAIRNGGGKSALKSVMTAAGAPSHKNALKSVDTSRRVPTLDEILSARSGLRKISAQGDPAANRKSTLPVGGPMPFLQDIARGAYTLRKVDGQQDAVGPTQGKDACKDPNEPVQSVEIAVKGESVEAPGREDPGREDPGREAPGREAPGREAPGREDPGRTNIAQSQTGILPFLRDIAAGTFKLRKRI